MAFSSLLREFPLAFLIKLNWWYWTLLACFGFSVNFWSLHQIWMKVLLGRVFLIAGFPLSLHLIYCSTSFWLAEFLLKSQLITLWDFPCKWLAFPLLILIVSLFLNSCHFIYNMSCVFFFGLILFGTLWFMDLHICFLSQVREIFCCYDFRYVLWPFLSFSLSLSLSSFWDSYNANISIFDNVPEVS